MKYPSYESLCAKQKFQIGQKVRVCKEMPRHMSHFHSDFEATVLGTYAQLYRKGHCDEARHYREYSLYSEEFGSLSWYDEDQLTAI